MACLRLYIFSHNQNIDYSKFVIFVVFLSHNLSFPIYIAVSIKISVATFMNESLLKVEFSIQLFAI